jgi:hypothetical protein
VRRAGQYLIGPRLGVSPVKSIVHCLGRREGTDRYFLLKILQLVIGAKESQVLYYLNIYAPLFLIVREVIFFLRAKHRIGYFEGGPRLI